MITYADFAAADTFLSTVLSSDTGSVPLSEAEDFISATSASTIEDASVRHASEATVALSRFRENFRVVGGRVFGDTPLAFPTLNRFVLRSSPSTRQSQISSSSSSHFSRSGAIKAIFTNASPTEAMKYDAAALLLALPSFVPDPHIWGDADEVVFEWFDVGKHAIASFEGDGLVGYTMLVEGSFQPGAFEDHPAGAIPTDLLDYIASA